MHQKLFQEGIQKRRLITEGLIAHLGAEYCYCIYIDDILTRRQNAHNLGCDVELHTQNGFGLMPVHSRTNERGHGRSRADEEGRDEQSRDEQGQD